MASEKRRPTPWTKTDFALAVLLMYLFVGAYWLSSEFIWHSSMGLVRTFVFCAAAGALGMVLIDMRAIRRRERQKEREQF